VRMDKQAEEKKRQQQVEDSNTSADDKTETEISA
jgi:hypothetical protein